MYILYLSFKEPSASPGANYCSRAVVSTIKECCFL